MLLSGVQRFFQNQLHQNTHFNSETLSAIKSISPTSSRIASVTNLPSLAATPTAIKIQDINDTLQAAWWHPHPFFQGYEEFHEIRSSPKRAVIGNLFAGNHLRQRRNPEPGAHLSTCLAE